MKIQNINNLFLPKFKKQNNISFRGNLVTKPDVFIKSSNVIKTASAVAIGTAANAVSETLNNKIDITDNTINQLLDENGFKKNEKGRYFKKLSESEKNDLNNKYGKYSENIIKTFETPMPDYTRYAFKDFLKIGNMYELTKSHFNEAFSLFSRFENDFMLMTNVMDSLDKNPKNIQLLQNMVLNPHKDAETINSLSYFKKQNYREINGALRGQTTTDSDNLNKHINNISEYLDTQVIKEPIKLYRGDNLNVYHKVYLNDGKIINLAEMMHYASDKPEEIKRIREFVLDNELTAKHPAFLSTSIQSSVADDFASYGIHEKVVTEFDTLPNTKGAFIEPLNMTGILRNEMEVLLQRNTNVKIKDINFEDGIWKVQAEISN